MPSRKRKFDEVKTLEEVNPISHDENIEKHSQQEKTTQDTSCIIRKDLTLSQVERLPRTTQENVSYERKIKKLKKLKRGRKRKPVEELSIRQINRRYQENLDAIIKLIKSHPEVFIQTFDFSVDFVLRNSDNQTLQSRTIMFKWCDDRLVIIEKVQKPSKKKNYFF